MTLRQRRPCIPPEKLNEANKWLEEKLQIEDIFKT
jgi:hypothetical protein